MWHVSPAPPRRSEPENAWRSSGASALGPAHVLCVGCDAPHPCDAAHRRRPDELTTTARRLDDGTTAEKARADDWVVPGRWRKWNFQAPLLSESGGIVDDNILQLFECSKTAFLGYDSTATRICSMVPCPARQAVSPQKTKTKHTSSSTPSCPPSLNSPFAGSLALRFILQREIHRYISQDFGNPKD